MYTSDRAGLDENEFQYGSDQDNAEMFNIICNAARSQAIHCAAQFSFADHLGSDTRTAEDIAAREDLDPGATFRLMRACVAFGFMTYDKQAGFSATPLLKTLRRDNPASLRNAALSILGQGFWSPFRQLHEAVRTGIPQAEATLGANFWQYYASPEGTIERTAFIQSLSSLSKKFIDEATALIGTDQIGRVLDVGGGNGSFVHALMQKNLSLQGAVLDLPHVVPDARSASETLGLQDRFDAYEGDFLVDVPSADLYLVKFILHDWQDDQCSRILQNCRRSAKTGARLVIAELVLDDVAPTSFAAWLDLTMLVLFGAKERTYEEFTGLLQNAGFQPVSLTKSKTPYSIIEAVAI